ncbi:hypothetical protein [Methylopila sp. M107]|nr:hypothetical protein [Methylopila sp. M107]
MGPVWIEWGVPIGGLIIAAAGYFYARYTAAQFDRKYGKRG